MAPCANPVETLVDIEHVSKAHTVRDEKLAPHEVWASVRHHCHDPEFDLRLVTRFVEIVYANVDCPAVASLLPLGGTVSKEACHAIRPILRCLRLMHLCGYDREDIEVVAAHAAVYFEECLAKLEDGKSSMQLRELSLIVCMLLFLGHTYVLDNTCPLKYWHKHVFAQVCGLEVVNAAVFRLMTQRGFVLRADSGILDTHLSFLRDGCIYHDV